MDSRCSQQHIKKTQNSLLVHWGELFLKKNDSCTAAKVRQNRPLQSLLSLGTCCSTVRANGRPVPCRREKSQTLMSRARDSKRCMSSWTYNGLKAQDEFQTEPCCQRHHPSQRAIKKRSTVCGTLPDISLNIISCTRKGTACQKHQ